RVPRLRRFRARGRALLRELRLERGGARIAPRNLLGLLVLRAFQRRLRAVGALALGPELVRERVLLGPRRRELLLRGPRAIGEGAGLLLGTRDGVLELMRARFSGLAGRARARGIGAFLVELGEPFEELRAGLLELVLEQGDVGFPPLIERAD